MQNISRNYQRILTKFLEDEAWPKGQPISFGGDADHDPHPGFVDQDQDPHPVIFKGFFIYYCDAYRQIGIKHENSRRRYAL